MIAKGKSISHGAAMTEYAKNRDKAQFLTSKFMNLEFEETFGIMPDNVWSAFKIHAMRHSPVTNSLMRFELAPAKEECKGWTHDEWKAFLDEFIAVMDSIKRVRYRDKNGKWKVTDVKPTNLSHSQAIAYLHLNTDDNHLHFLVNRIDEDGNLNDDTFLLNRAFQAAQIINERRGWKDTLVRSEEIKKAIRETTFDALKNISEFSWDAFKEAMLNEGLVVKTKEANGKVVSYKVHYEGHKNSYKASDIDRSLTAAHIADTCAKLWRKNTIDEAKSYMQEYAKQHPNVRFVEVEDYSEEDETFARDNMPRLTLYDDKKEDDDIIHHHYQFGFYECSFELKRVIEALLESELKRAVAEEKRNADSDYLTFFNKNFDFESTFKVAAMLFIGYVNGATAMSESIGGGGSSCTSDWGKKDDDEKEWARHCARQAMKMCKPNMTQRSVRRGR